MSIVFELIQYVEIDHVPAAVAMSKAALRKTMMYTRKNIIVRVSKLMLIDLADV